MEQTFKIVSPDKKIIFGTHNEGNNECLIIFVHGLTGHQNEHLFYNAAKYFPKKGFDTVRFDLYTWEDKGRNLRECTIDTHSRDIETVIKHFSKMYTKIYLVGHSLGGPAILLAEVEKIRSIVLWDPSYDIFKNLQEEMIFLKETNSYLVNWGVEYLLSKEMVESYKKLGKNLTNHFTKPTKMIFAGKEILHKAWKESIPLIQTECESIVIEEAGHCFDESDTENRLFQETLNWFTSK